MLLCFPHGTVFMIGSSLSFSTNYMGYMCKQVAVYMLGDKL